MERLNNIEALRQRDLDDLQSTLITACTPREGSGLSDPIEENEDLVIGNNSESCPLCREFSVHKEVARHLKICATPKIYLPSHFNSLLYTYKDVETSINTIRETVDALSNDHLLNEI